MALAPRPLASLTPLPAASLTSLKATEIKKQLPEIQGPFLSCPQALPVPTRNMRPTSLEMSFRLPVWVWPRVVVSLLSLLTPLSTPHTPLMGTGLAVRPFLCPGNAKELRLPWALQGEEEATVLLGLALFFQPPTPLPPSLT